MERIRGLEEYVKNKEYREALGLPKEKTENYELLAQGEYNINYAFTHSVTGKKLLLRVNCGSQMHLEHQIEYEAHALRLMEGSGRTPKVLYVDGSKKYWSMAFWSWNTFRVMQWITYRIDAGSSMSGRHSQCPDSRE